MVRLIKEDWFDDSIDYKQQCNEFLDKVKALASKYGIEVTVPVKDIHPERNIGRAALYFTYAGEDIAFIDYYFDYAEDPDYPNRDWFVTFNLRNYVTDKAHRYDFFNNDEALSFLKGFFLNVVKAANKQKEYS